MDSIDPVKGICEKLLEFSSKRFLLIENSDKHLGVMAETLYALLRFLVGKWRDGRELLQGSQRLPQALETVLTPVDDDIEEESRSGSSSDPLLDFVPVEMELSLWDHRSRQR